MSKLKNKAINFVQKNKAINFVQIVDDEDIQVYVSMDLLLIRPKGMEDLCMTWPHIDKLKAELRIKHDRANSKAKATPNNIKAKTLCHLRKKKKTS